MGAKLCKPCSEVPPDFWSSAHDEDDEYGGIKVALHSFRSIEAAAADGCPLCKVLMSRARNMSLCPEDTLKTLTLYLGRKKSFQVDGLEICLLMHNDSIAYVPFSTVPEEWKKLPTVPLGTRIENIEIMRTWIQDCYQNHKLCHENTASFLPTRLLDLEAFDADLDLRLVSIKLEDFAQESSIPKYTALSHCWGPEAKWPITTTKATLADRLTRISFDSLSHTFCDAVRVTRMLGMRYLWIDSLCIIQNDEHDWVKEAAFMAEVYGQAHCTIAALHSSDSTGGCCLVPDIQRIGQFVDIDYEPYRVRLFYDQPLNWFEEYGDNPLQYPSFVNKHCPLKDRAWTLQERYLSRRTINFAKDQLLWECKELRATAQIPWKHTTQGPMSEGHPPARNNQDEGSGNSEAVKTRDRWYLLMEEYSSRLLTKETDKLIALAGVSRQWQQTFPNAKYLAGLWSTHLPAALLWRVKDKSVTRDATHVAPSWSWASVKGAITYDSQRLQRGTSQSENEIRCGNISIDTSNVTLMHSDQYGAVRDISITLNQALVAPIDSNPALDNFGQWPYTDISTAGITQHGVCMGLFYPDVKSEIQGVKDLFCLQIRPEIRSSLVERPPYLYDRDLRGNKGVTNNKHSSEATAKGATVNEPTLPPAEKNIDDGNGEQDTSQGNDKYSCATKDEFDHHQKGAPTDFTSVVNRKWGLSLPKTSEGQFIGSLESVSAGEQIDESSDGADHIVTAPQLSAMDRVAEEDFSSHVEENQSRVASPRPSSDKTWNNTFSRDVTYPGIAPLEPWDDDASENSEEIDFHNRIMGEYQVPRGEATQATENAAEVERESEIGRSGEHVYRNAMEHENDNQQTFLPLERYHYNGRPGRIRRQLQGMWDTVSMESDDSWGRAQKEYRLNGYEAAGLDRDGNYIPSTPSEELEEHIEGSELNADFNMTDALGDQEQDHHISLIDNMEDDDNDAGWEAELRKDPFYAKFAQEQELCENLVMGLALQKLEGGGGERYRRIGLARWVKKDVFKQSTPVSITLV